MYLGSVRATSPFSFLSPAGSAVAITYRSGGLCGERSRGYCSTRDTGRGAGIGVGRARRGGSLGKRRRGARLPYRQAERRGRTYKVLNRDAGTALLAFGGADDAFYAACVVQQGDPDAVTGARHPRGSAPARCAANGRRESPGALAVLAGVRQVPVKGLYATRRFVEALPPTLKIRFRIAGVDGNETFCGVRPGRLREPVRRAGKHRGRHRENQLRRARTGTRAELAMAREAAQSRPRSPGVTLGRAGSATIRIPTEFASRTHARLVFEQTNFVLHDESTNETMSESTRTRSNSFISSRSCSAVKGSSAWAGGSRMRRPT